MTKILLVEDEESFREGLSFMLSKEGYEVITADNGNDAVSKFEQHGADLVLLDVMLPGLSGLDVCKKLRTMTKVPIIMLTAKDTELDKVLGLEIGADDYITKPFSSRELLARVKAILRRVGGVEEKDFGTRNRTSSSRH
jgi:two-component system, OmpR family, response regulator RegX3